MPIVKGSNKKPAVREVNEVTAQPVKVLCVGDVPRYARPGDSGADLCAAEQCCIEAHSWSLVRTGLRVAIPEGYEAQVRPRSGLALKHGITVLNTPGTVDSGYRGEVGVIVMNHSDRAVILKKGERIAQLVICPVVRAEFVQVRELPDSARGEGGFGSTGV